MTMNMSISDIRSAYQSQSLTADELMAQNRINCARYQDRNIWIHVLTPTSPCNYTQKEILTEPISYNHRLGYYSYHTNLLDLSALAIPATFTGKGLPFGITLSAKPFNDRFHLSIAKRLESSWNHDYLGTIRQ